MLSSLFKLIIQGKVTPPDKLQLEAAQDRLIQRKTDLNEAADELTKMLKRMKNVRKEKRSGRA